MEFRVSGQKKKERFVYGISLSFRCIVCYFALFYVCFCCFLFKVSISVIGLSDSKEILMIRRLFFSQGDANEMKGTSCHLLTERSITVPSRHYFLWVFDVVFYFVSAHSCFIFVFATELVISKDVSSSGEKFCLRFIVPFLRCFI